MLMCMFIITPLVNYTLYLTMMKNVNHPDILPELDESNWLYIWIGLYCIHRPCYNCGISSQCKTDALVICDHIYTGLLFAITSTLCLQMTLVDVNSVVTINDQILLIENMTRTIDITTTVISAILAVIVIDIVNITRE